MKGTVELALAKPENRRAAFMSMRGSYAFKDSFAPSSLP
jgi:hypothetical protein